MLFWLSRAVAKQVQSRVYDLSYKLLWELLSVIKINTIGPDESKHVLGQLFPLDFSGNAILVVESGCKAGTELGV